MESKWIAFLGDIGTGINFLILAILIIRKIRTGCITGSRLPPYSVVTVLFVASVFRCIEAFTNVSQVFTPIEVALAKVATALVSLWSVTVYMFSGFYYTEGDGSGR